MKVVDLTGGCLFPEHLVELKKYVRECLVYKNVPHVDTEILKKIADADIVISFLMYISGYVISNSSNLKLICLGTTGYDEFDFDAAVKKGVKVCYCPGYATNAVAEHTMGLMLNAARLSFKSMQDLKNNIYDHAKYRGKELKGKFLAIIGYGKIGREVAKIARDGFGMQILTYDVNCSRDDFEKILKMADFISIHLPLLPSTKKIIGAREFELMKNGVVIVNTARGGILDEVALVANIKLGKVFAAGLDVLEEEPMKLTDPVLAVSNICVTPHISYNSDEAIFYRSKMISENIIKFIQGKPENMVCE